MQSILSNAPGLIFLLALVGVLVFIGFRLGIRFLIRRLASLVFVALGVSFITFILGHFAPFDIVYFQLGVHYTPARGAELRHLYGLDLPWYEQYGRYLNNLLHFNLGYSWNNVDQRVWDILARYLPASMELGLWGTFFTVALGVPLGVAIALRPNSRFDTVTQVVALVLYALPTFAIIPFFVLAMVWLHNNNLPSLATSGWGHWDQEIGPIAIYAAGGFGYFVRLTRTSMIEELGKDYVRSARAKGMSEQIVVWRHAFRNAALPLLSALGPTFAGLVTGVFIIEDLFNIPGIGNETLIATVSGDVPIVQATAILLAVAIVLMNLFTDVAYGLADPRIKTVS